MSRYEQKICDENTWIHMSRYEQKICDERLDMIGNISVSEIIVMAFGNRTKFYKYSRKQVHELLVFGIRPNRL